MKLERLSVLIITSVLAATVSISQLYAAGEQAQSPSSGAGSGNADGQPRFNH